MSCKCQTITENHQAYINGLRQTGPQCGAISGQKQQSVCPPRNPCQKPLWNHITQIREDPCAQATQERESQVPGCYQTNNFFRWSTTPQEYAEFMTEPAQYQKVYRDACNVDADSDLRYAPLTNFGQIQQLYRAPYPTVGFMGAGSRSLANKGLESELQQGLTTTRFKACEPTSGVTIDRYECLPDYGNPQKVEHVIPPWVRGGENSRDFVRRVNYDKYCLNQANNKIINQQWRNGIQPAIWGPFEGLK